MFEPNLSIDISLLGIILGLYATKNDRNLILLLICLLFAHVLLTKGDDDFTNNFEEDVNQSEGGVMQSTESVGVTEDSLGAPATATAAATETRKAPSKADMFTTTVSSGVFDRQLSTPQTNLTSTVFPSTSVEANGKLASARGSFFKSLVS